MSWIKPLGPLASRFQGGGELGHQYEAQADRFANHDHHDHLDHQGGQADEAQLLAQAEQPQAQPSAIVWRPLIRS